MGLPEADVAMIARVAEDVLVKIGLIRVSAEGFADFMAVVSARTSPVPEMAAVVKRSAPWEPGYVAKR